MAEDHRSLDAQSVQEVLLDEPSFLREIVERVLQEMLEAEMTHHIGAAPYERSTQPDLIGFVLSPQPATEVTCTQGTQVSPVREGDVVVKDSLG